MKITLNSVCRAISLAMLFFATGFVAGADRAGPHQDRTTSDQRPNKVQSSGPNHARGPIKPAKPNHLQPLPNRRTHITAPESAKSVPSPASRRPTGVTNGAPVTGEGVNIGALNKTGSTHSATVARSPSPPPSNVRHHVANPAIVGGPINPATVNAGGINGSHMSRKP
jgi:hypothetical protein